MVSTRAAIGSESCRKSGKGEIRLEMSPKKVGLTPKNQQDVNNEGGHSQEPLNRLAELVGWRN